MFHDRRTNAGTFASLGGAMARLNGQGTRKDGMRTRQAAARMAGTHADMQTGQAAYFSPVTRPSGPAERTISPVPAMPADQMRPSNSSPLQMAANRLTSRPMAGPESPLMAMANTASAVQQGSAAVFGRAPMSTPMSPMQHQPPTTRTNPWSEFMPTAQPAMNVLPQRRMGRMR